MTGPVFKFMDVHERDAAAGVTDLSADPTMRLFAQAIALQQGAGFGSLLDCRQIPCPTCKAPGFNDGWGAIIHTCGAEIVGGEFAKECPIEAAIEGASS